MVKYEINIVKNDDELLSVASIVKILVLMKKYLSIFKNLKDKLGKRDFSTHLFKLSIDENQRQHISYLLENKLFTKNFMKKIKLIRLSY